MKQKLMKKQNWIMVITGILVTYLGFLIIRTITTDYDGMKAFISIFITIAGLTVVILGLSISFREKEDEKEQP